MRTPRRYDREHWLYQADRALAEQYAVWLRQVPWQLFCTLTFAWKVSDPQAARCFTTFINQLERYYRCDFGYVRGDEKRFSGCGKPACPRHYHALFASAAIVNPKEVEELWMSMVGHRSDGAGAKVEPYDPNQNGVSYVLKHISHPGGDWTCGKLELFLPPVSGMKITKRMRRRLRRHHERQRLLR